MPLRSWRVTSTVSCEVEAGDQLHDRLGGDGVHEVHADDPLRVRADRGDPGDRDRGGVDDHDRLRAEDPVELGVHPALDVPVLGDVLDHEVGLGQRLDADGGGDAAQDLVGVQGGPAHQAAEPAVAADGRLGVRQDLLVDVDEDGLVAGLGQVVRDSDAHDPGTDDSYDGHDLSASLTGGAGGWWWVCCTAGGTGVCRAGPAAR